MYWLYDYTINNHIINYNVKLFIILCYKKDGRILYQHNWNIFVKQLIVVHYMHIKRKI